MVSFGLLQKTSTKNTFKLEQKRLRKDSLQLMTVDCLAFAYFSPLF